MSFSPSASTVFAFSTAGGGCSRAALASFNLPPTSSLNTNCFSWAFFLNVGTLSNFSLFTRRWLAASCSSFSSRLRPRELRTSPLECTTDYTLTQAPPSPTGMYHLLCLTQTLICAVALLANTIDLDRHFFL